MGALLHRDPNSPPLTIVRAAGCYLYDRAGRDYLDASAAAGAATCGYEDIGPWEFCTPPHSALATTEAAEELATDLVKDYGDPEAGVFFLSTGSEAIEAACKIAVFYQRALRGDADWRILSRQRSYHGNTLWSLGLSDAAARRAPYERLLLERPYLWPIPTYPTDRQGKGDWEGFHRANTFRLDEREALVTKATAAVLVESVAGTMAGIVIPHPGYMAALRAHCEQQGWLLIADEILAGNHRAGLGMFASNSPGCRADIVVAGKSLAAGWWPLSAVIVSGRVRKVIEKAGQLPHTSTFMNHGIACDAARLARSWQARYGNPHASATLRFHLNQLYEDHASISYLRGNGMLWGIELQDPETLQPCPAPERMAYKVQKACLNERLIIYAARGCRGLYEGDQLVVMPAYTITDQEIVELVDRLRRGLQKAFESRHN